MELNQSSCYDSTSRITNSKHCGFHFLLLEQNCLLMVSLPSKGIDESVNSGDPAQVAAM